MPPPMPPERLKPPPPRLMPPPPRLKPPPPRPPPPPPRPPRVSPSLATNNTRARNAPARAMRNQVRSAMTLPLVLSQIDLHRVRSGREGEVAGAKCRIDRPVEPGCEGRPRRIGAVDDRQLAR